MICKNFNPVLFYLPQFFSSAILLQSTTPSHRLYRGMHILPQLKLSAGQRKTFPSLTHWKTSILACKRLQRCVFNSHKPPQPLGSLPSRILTHIGAWNSSVFKQISSFLIHSWQKVAPLLVAVFEIVDSCKLKSKKYPA